MGIRLANETDFRLGRISVCPSQSRITASGAVTRIEPRMMQVLVALAQASETTVARSELIERCWGGLIVSTDALNRVIARLRRLLDEAGGGFAIETLPRIGYRLAAAGPPAVARVGAVAAALAAEPSAPAEQLQELYRRALHGLLA